ncbi:hypothetical protein [Burkholderia plantarii]|uniref:hypothetical protein n=1 Tax=Burkholderia plantarii TaxID=41899 RepID=UPI000A8E3296|nr:hypothetical protein [Burkholderia plantarii]
MVVSVGESRAGAAFAGRTAARYRSIAARYEKAAFGEAASRELRITTAWPKKGV